MVAKQSFNLIVIDGLLPDTDGITLISNLRRLGVDTPIVFMSAFLGMIESLSRWKDELQVALLVHKPILSSAFCEKLEKCEEQALIHAPIRDDIRDEPSLVAARKEYARKLPAKLQDIAQLMRRAKTEPDPFLINEIRERAHRLRGTAGCYGFVEIGEAAGEIEDALKERDDADRPTVPRDWDTIARSLAEAAEAAASDERAREERPAMRAMPLGVGAARILVVDSDPLFLSCLDCVSQEQLIEVVRATEANIIEKASIAPPDAVILSLSSRATAGIAQKLRALPGGERLPLGFACVEHDIEARMVSSKVGRTLHLVRSMDQDTLGLAVRQLLAMRDTERRRVLVLTENASLARRLRELLEHSGHTVTLEREASNILATLDQCHPDALVIDSESQGIDVCRLLRSDPEWQSLPALVLGPRDDAESRLVALRAGADDYLTDNVSDEEILARIDVRLDRMRILHERFDKDTLTDLPLRRPFLERLAKAMAESRRHGRALSVALLDLDLFKAVNDKHGHGAADRVLATLGRLLDARFRAEDLRGRWGGEEFVVAFPGESADALHGALANALDDFGTLFFRSQSRDRFHATFSAGIASYPKDGGSVRALLDVADRRLYMAKRGGRATVVSRG